MNFFPVADKDTGTNMSMSLEIVSQSLTKGPWPGDVLNSAVDTLVNKAHGNSGTILTMFFKGMAACIPEAKDIDGQTLAEAYINGANTAFNSIPQIVDGTIISLMKKTADSCMPLMADPEADPLAVWDRIYGEALGILPLTAFQNPSLRKFKIPDAGAAGFCIILDSFRKAFNHEADTDVSAELMGLLPDALSADFEGWTVSAPYRYCTEMVIGLNQAASDNELETMAGDLQKKLSPMGDCMIVVPYRSHIKLHIHTNEPEIVHEFSKKYGRIISRKVDDMLASYEAPSEDGAEEENIFVIIENEDFIPVVQSLGFERVYTAKSFIKAEIAERLMSDILYTSVKLPPAVEGLFRSTKHFESDEEIIEHILE
ncbi:MAG: DAK2 domain-containing protein [Parasporobacterium sp.]|nr:DAK2 domain-containing protein [Parasporobacterium sp.]